MHFRAAPGSPVELLNAARDLRAYKCKHMLTNVSKYSGVTVSPRELLTLRLLIDNPTGLYGSDFVSISKGKLGRGSIYTMLDRLVSKGYVREVADPRAADILIARTRHLITPKGMREYQAFLADQGLAMIVGAFGR